MHRVICLLLSGACIFPIQPGSAAPAPKPAPARPAAGTTSSASNIVSRGEAAAISGNLAEAAKLFQSALTSAQAAQDKKGMVLALDRLANCYQSQQDATEEEAARRKALASSKSAYGAQSPQTAMQLAQLGGALVRKGAIGEARQSIDDAKAIMEKCGGDHKLETAVLNINQAAVQSGQGLASMAEESLKHACTLLSDNPSARYYLARALEEHAAILDQLERKDDAKADREKLALLRGTSTAGGTTVARSPAGGSAFDKHVKAAQEAMVKLDRDAALANWKLALAEAEKGSESDGKQAFVLVHLGDEYWLKTQSAEAEAMFKRALELRRKAAATKTLGMARNLWRLANCALAKQDYQQTEALLTEALQIEEQCGANDSIIAGTMTPLMTACTMTKNTSKAEGVCKRLLSIAANGTVSNAAVLKNMATGMLGSIYMQTGRLEQGMNLMKTINPQQPPPAVAGKASLEELLKIEKAFDDAETKAWSSTASAAH